MLDRISKIFQIVLLLSMLATVGFVFYQSSLPPEKSSAESDKVGDIVADIIPPETPAGDYVQKNIRKIAHFVEFAFLGGEMALYVCFFARKLKFGIYSLISAPLIALCDESIQIFTERGPSVTDVWIDVSGFLSSSAVVYAVFFIAFFIIKGVRARRA